jgi:hypothetical protein
MWTWPVQQKPLLPPLPPLPPRVQQLLVLELIASPVPALLLLLPVGVPVLAWLRLLPVLPLQQRVMLLMLLVWQLVL